MIMSRREKQWILLVNHHRDDTWILPEGDQRTYEIAPKNEIKRGDIVYLWWNPHRCFYGWGEVAETPKNVVTEFPRPNNDVEKKKRTSVLVNRKSEIRPPITAAMMERDSNLKNLIPKEDDLCAIYLRPGQAGYLNDFITQLGGKAPLGSSTLVVHTHEPQLIKELGDFNEKEKLLLSYHYVDRLPLSEIAGFWSLPVETVEQHLEIAIRKLLSFKHSSYLDKVEGKTLKDQEPPVSLIEVVEAIKSLTPDLIHHLKQNEDDFKKLRPDVFEHLVGELLQQRGFDEVKLVGQDAKTSADILAVKKIHEINSEVRYFVEVKRWKDRVGIEVINQVYGAMLMEQRDYGWSAAMIVSLVGYTKQRKITSETLTRLNVSLKQKDDLLCWLKEYEPKGGGLWLPPSKNYPQ
jgi:HJR/Mrr/RecB family endonuclease